MPRITLTHVDLLSLANAAEESADAHIRSAFTHDLVGTQAADDFASDDRQAASYLRALAKRLRSYA